MQSYNRLRHPPCCPTLKFVGVTGAVSVVAEMSAEAVDWPLVVFTVQIMKVYCVPDVNPEIDFVVALAAAVVVVSESQLDGAVAPNL